MISKSAVAGFFAGLVLYPFSLPVLADETGMASMHEWRRERGKTCMAAHFHSGYGEGRSKKRAMNAAVLSWREFTAAEYGTDWAYWRRASSKSARCNGSGAFWSCSIEARPCRRR